MDDVSLESMSYRDIIAVEGREHLDIIGEGFSGCDLHTYLPVGRDHHTLGWFHLLADPVLPNWMSNP